MIACAGMGIVMAGIQNNHHIFGCLRNTSEHCAAPCLEASQNILYGLIRSYAAIFIQCHHIRLYLIQQRLVDKHLIRLCLRLAVDAIRYFHILLCQGYMVCFPLRLVIQSIQHIYTRLFLLLILHAKTSHVSGNSLCPGCKFLACAGIYIVKESILQYCAIFAKARHNILYSGYL